ncbi:hypothetical protein HMPREF0663_10766 [Hoylesella oralis ATCC 33269]|uniref:Putative auto-transporter adhesin head GIN domain-containing protein n=1 Tax=Hoylesella oralis ATCC 33269 TaxID=873533 RepID=E7RNL5_9BACT|nr:MULTISPECIES: head GIN domain-containing protein [Prevotellaceae]EFZ37308.1 hypothetical protein HMPREF0663_10766 [Hoylesella oralis ATCC 33269]EPH14894.1 hypothetical protein HMPREF1475_02287 [Hoylesella oralis HGA0225]ETD15801.1 hypothetical protein HMPREF1199_02496 [Hoylesella oralis CC98A]SHG07490.1 Putative auto-transporter adhesin, head GIN domain [Hoylesella oralis]
MKKVNLILCGVLAATVLSSCVYRSEVLGKRVVLDSTRKTDVFNKVTLFASCNVHYKQGDTCSVRVVGDKQLVKNLITQVINNELQIRMKPYKGDLMRLLNKTELNVYVTSPDLLAVKVAGSGDFEATGTVDTDTMRIALTGSGDMDFANLICDRVEATLRGSGDVELKNVQADYANLNLLGSGDMKVNLKNARNADASLTGSGDLKVGFDNCGIVNCKLLGSGDIELKGRIRQLNQNSTGSGDIETSGLKVGY